MQPTNNYTLSLHDALPISNPHISQCVDRTTKFRDKLKKLGSYQTWEDGSIQRRLRKCDGLVSPVKGSDRKSTRLNSSHITSSYAVFCLKKKILYYTNRIVA